MGGEGEGAYAQLDVVFAQEHGSSAKGGDGAFSGDSRAGAALVEGHGDGLACQLERWGQPFSDLMSTLCFPALRTRVVSSWGVRSAMESRCRGAKGEVCGVAGELELA